MPSGVVRSGTVTVRLYATAREVARQAVVELPVPANGEAARDLLRRLVERWPRLGPVLPTCRFVRNDRYLRGLSTRLRAGDEFAVHPPYGGG